MNYKIYQYIYQKDKYFIYLYKSAGGVCDHIHGMIIAKDKETQEWKFIPSVTFDEDSFNHYYQGLDKVVNLDNLIINHVLGALDII